MYSFKPNAVANYIIRLSDYYNQVLPKFWGISWEEHGLEILESSWLLPLVSYLAKEFSDQIKKKVDPLLIWNKLLILDRLWRICWAKSWKNLSIGLPAKMNRLELFHYWCFLFFNLLYKALLPTSSWLTEQIALFSSWKMLKVCICLFLLKVESYILLVIWQSKTSHKETVVPTTDESPLELTCEETQVAIIEDEEKAPDEGTCGRVDIDDDGASTTPVVRQLMLVEHQHKEVQV